MSVIGKMTVNGATVFDKGQKVEMSCVCENELMAHYHPENENVVFTRYSPSGQATLHFDKLVDLPKMPTSYDSTDRDGVKSTHHYDKVCELYLVYLKQPEQPNLDGATFFARLRVNCISIYSGTSKQVELCNVYHRQDHAFAANEARLANLKLGIDNPAAADQFVPGEEGWWVVGYRAAETTQADALALAHAGS